MAAGRHLGTGTLQAESAQVLASLMGPAVCKILQPFCMLSANTLVVHSNLIVPPAGGSAATWDTCQYRRQVCQSQRWCISGGCGPLGHPLCVHIGRLGLRWSLVVAGPAQSRQPRRRQLLPRAGPKHYRLLMRSVRAGRTSAPRSHAAAGLKRHIEQVSFIDITVDGMVLISPSQVHAASQAAALRLPGSNPEPSLAAN